MVAVNPDRVREAFDASADYAGNAAIQRRIAAALADRIKALNLPLVPRILEIGCGTGFLTQELLGRGIAGHWLITDKAAAMVQRCRKAIGDAPSRQFAVLDGEFGTGERDGRFDLICASMAMQWFEDLPAAAARLKARLAPGGHLVFNTLAAGTFNEWREAHRACGLSSGAVAFPAVTELRAAMAGVGAVSSSVEHHVEVHDNARQFLFRLKSIGASTPRNGHKPLAPRQLKQVMKQFDLQGARTSYEVMTFHMHGGSSE